MHRGDAFYDRAVRILNVVSFQITKLSVARVIYVILAEVAELLVVRVKNIVPLEISEFLPAARNVVPDDLNHMTI